MNSNTLFTKEQLVLRFSQDVALTVFTSAKFSEAQFFAPRLGKWSAAEQVKHLSLAAKPLVLALRLPRLVLSLLFGKAKKGSRSYEAIVSLYESKLKAGAKATGDYIPQATQQTQEQLTNEFRCYYEKLAAGVATWREADLDTYRLPHPIIGKLTIREMMYFTLYHQTHHHQTLLAYWSAT